ncbi:MAG: hypothetical protein JSV52_12050 [Candidatus Zixiibacteriota bacterium]|nr:MAG: hypothetical protein JSV52_12050 [candidate division Zixibacteria bacterium]
MRRVSVLAAIAVLGIVVLFVNACVTYHTRAFWPEERYEKKHVDIYTCWIEFNAYIRGYSDPSHRGTDWKANDTFYLTLNIADTLTPCPAYAPYEDTLAQLAVRDSIEQDHRQRVERVMHVDSAVLHCYPVGYSITLPLSQEREPDFRWRTVYYHFETVNIPLTVTDIDVVFHYSEYRLDGQLADHDSLVFETHRVEKHKLGFWPGR